MKLALIRRQFAATGGAELYLQRLLGRLVALGHEPHLFAESWDETLKGVTFHRVQVGGSRATRPLNFAHAVRAQLAAEKLDCVFSLERTLKQDVYRAGDGLHRVWLERRRQFAPWWKKPFVGRGAFHRNMLALEAQTFDPANTRHAIVNSEMVRQEILRHFPFPPERIHLVRNGVDLGRFQTADRATARARFGIKSDEYLLLFVGSGWERKGLKYVLRAARAFLVERLVAGRPFRIAKVLVVGKGKKPTNAPPNAIFPGPLADVEQAYAAADLFVFLPIYEPSANVVFEALAAGLPVVTSGLNGASEVIEDRVNGTVIDDPSDTQSVVQAISYWWSRRFITPPVRAVDLSLERNVAETLAVLELAAKERAS